MTDKEFKRLSRAQLIEIIYQLQLQIDKLNEEKQALENELEDKRLRLQSAGNIAEAALEINDCFRSAQNAAEQYLNEIKAIREETEAERQRIDEASEAQIATNAATWRAAQQKILQGELQTLQQSQELRRAARDYEASEERTYQEKMQSERLKLKELQVEEENARYEAARDATFANELLTEEARLNTLDTLQMEHDANRLEIERQYQSEREKLQRETDARILESQEDAEKMAEQMGIEA